MSLSPPTQPGVRVDVRDLRKSYGSQVVLDGVNLSVGPGEIFVLMGPSGSGKTVLLKQVIGLEKPDAGEVLIEGQPIASAAVTDHYRMAMVFQSGALLNSLTVGENVGLYLTEHRLRPPAEISQIVREKLELIGLRNVENKFPNELSGGMKKRVSIARALVSEPQLILYDEPTSELDPLMAVTIAQEIVALRRRGGVTSLVVTHDRDLAFGIADRMAIIEAGAVLFTGTPEEIKRNPHPSIQRFLNAEFKILTEP